MKLKQLNSFKKVRKVFAVVTIGIFCSGSVFAAGEGMSAIYSKIDTMFTERSEKGLSSVLSVNSDKDDYDLIERYTENKIRRLIIDNDFDFALSALTVLVENNLDNEKAVETYSDVLEAWKYDQSLKNSSKK